MADNLFNPGFDREKKAFIDLANRGEGLTPINYLFADEANFESVQASYVTGGMFDINMLYATAIEAVDIITTTITADTAYIDTAYVNTAYIEKITIKKAYVDYLYADHVTIYDDLTVGKLNSPAAVDFYSSYYKVVNDSIFEILTPAFSLDSPAVSIVSQLINITAPTPSGLVSFNAPFFGINVVESSVLPMGKVGIYSGGSISMSAPITTIGATVSVGNQPTVLTLNALEEITIGNQEFNSPAVLRILGVNTTISGQIFTLLARTMIINSQILTIEVEERMTSIAPTTSITGTIVLNLLSDIEIKLKSEQLISFDAVDVHMMGTASISLNSNTEIRGYSPNITLNTERLLSLFSSGNIVIKSEQMMEIDCDTTIIFDALDIKIESEETITAKALETSIIGAEVLNLFSPTAITYAVQLMIQQQE